MSSSGFNYQPPVIWAPTAPHLNNDAGDDMAPPSYEEALRAPSAGGSFSSIPSAARLTEAQGQSAPFLAGAGTADPRADPEVGGVGAHQTDASTTTTAATGPPAPPTSGDDPPSYHSLFGQIKEAKESSSGIGDFLLNLLLMPVGCLFGLALVAVVVGLVFGLPVTLLTVGSLYMSECPVEPGIPIWMVVGGAFIVVYIFWVSCTDEEAAGRQAVVGALFFIAWYIAGCVLIYPTWQPPFEPAYMGDTYYCDYTLMMTAFVIINLLSVLTSLGFCTGCL